MPITAVIATITALSMAGIPFLNGFLSKEMMLEEAAHTTWLNNHYIVPVFATLGALMSVGYSLRYIFHVFAGPVRDDYPHKPHDPNFGMWAAPALLAVLVVLIGVMPKVFAGPLVAVASGATIGGDLPYYSLKLWHGITPALFMSIIAVGGGAVLLWLHGGLQRVWLSLPRPEAKTIYDALVSSVVQATAWVTQLTHNGAITRYLAIFVVATVALSYLAFTGGGQTPATRATLPIPFVAFVGWTLLVVGSFCVVRFHHRRFLALVVVGVVGLMVSMGFVYLSAPDLAMTQITVETVTIMLLLLALNFLPRETPRESTVARRTRDGVIALGAGGGIALLTLAFLTRDFTSISEFHLANSKTGGGGTNVVNVILVDFRGYDTYGEIIVLGIAGLTIYALMDALLRGPASQKLRNWVFDRKRSADRHPMMMVVVTRLLLPIALMVGVYIFLRGHNQPGGGFVAGLIAAIAFLMQYMASGFVWTQERQRIAYHTFIGFGVLIAGLTGVGSFLAGRPFLTSSYGYFHIPPIEEFELATAALFDLGVFLTVLGAVMLMLYSLSRLARLTGESVNVGAMDFDPSTAGEDATAGRG